MPLPSVTQHCAGDFELRAFGEPPQRQGKAFSLFLLLPKDRAFWETHLFPAIRSPQPLSTRGGRLMLHTARLAPQGAG